MDHPQTPRILAPHLANFQHRIVRILGKVTQLRGETAVIDAGGNVDVVLNREYELTKMNQDSHLAVGHAVEIIGKVDQNLQVKVQAVTDFGTNIDFNAANAVVDATHRYKEIFYDDN
ncbi:replication factor a protein 3 [Alternaria burnsii]|uniref:Replication factor a protein 3 n=1 Tax=Alternaria burnsii TaxID=1187904 RepID=A0A8H7EM29_9PLEO|nr:replication factor a protein 3 [Alternaria burnsii]KAF7680717.1 replication factor a protein 3 [Alternaria burnsii]